MIKRIKELKKGTQRLLLIISFIPAIIVQSSFGFLNEDFWAPLFISWIGYWIIVRVILWIIDGYRK